MNVAKRNIHFYYVEEDYITVTKDITIKNITTNNSIKYFMLNYLSIKNIIYFNKYEISSLIRLNCPYIYTRGLRYISCENLNAPYIRSKKVVPKKILQY